MTAAPTCTPVAPVLQHAGCSDQCGTFPPEDDAPPVLVVGAMASHDRVVPLLLRLAEQRRALQEVLLFRLTDTL